MKSLFHNALALCLCIFPLSFSGCKPQNGLKASNRVVLYCSVDDVYAKPIIKELEAQTGLKIDVLYDTEAAKTAGLANKIRAEKNRPQGDVFWSSALLQTLLLKREGLLQAYVSPSAKDIPAMFKAKDGSWTGLGVRARVWVGNLNNMVGLSPFSITTVKPTQKNVSLPNIPIGMSNPQFGTASDWAAALGARFTNKKTLEYFRALKQMHIRIFPGNSIVAERVARHELFEGITDTDDFFAQKDKTDSRFQIIPDKDTVFIPGSVAILKKAPHNENAKKLVDALLKVETEKRLVNTMIGVLPTRPQIQVTQPELKALAANLKNAPDDTAKWPAAWDEIREPLAEILSNN